jgi:hypothetical protein
MDVGFAFRSLMRGTLDLNAMPAAVASQVRAMLARMQRQAARAAKRETKCLAYERNGLNGKRAVARRLRQIEAGRLQVSL